MRIAALSMMYNEEAILPYFLKHYEYADEIRILYETDSDDGTLDILAAHPKAVIENCHIEGGIDDVQKVAAINDAILRIDADWVYVLDSDEFIFPMGWENPYDFFARQEGYNIVMAAMYQVYRHKTDADLDPTNPPIPQRLHGDPDLFSTRQEPNRDCNSHYVKPCVLRPNSGISYLPGNHTSTGNIMLSPDIFYGSHWQNADPSIAISRRMQRKARISENNRKQFMGFQHYGITEEWIREECKRHENDPLIGELCYPN